MQKLLQRLGVVLRRIVLVASRFIASRGAALAYTRA
jgi:hypothetical protein